MLKQQQQQQSVDNLMTRSTISSSWTSEEDFSELFNYYCQSSFILRHNYLLPTPFYKYLIDKVGLHKVDRWFIHNLTTVFRWHAIPSLTESTVFNSFVLFHLLICWSLKYYFIAEKLRPLKWRVGEFQLPYSFRTLIDLLKCNIENNSDCFFWGIKLSTL